MMEPANEIEVFCPKCGSVTRITPEEANVQCQNPLCRAVIRLSSPRPTDDVAEFHRTLATLTPHAWVTPVLIAANGIVFLLMVFSGVSPVQPTIPDLIRWGADFGPKTTGGEWWRLFTCMFVHIGFIHILSNMWVLLAGGPLVERMVGNIGYLLLYLIAGLCSSLASLLWHPLLVSAGASGAVFGVYGAIVALLMRQGGSIPRRALQQVRNGSIVLIGINLFYGFTQPNIDFAAHLGGLVTGFVLGLVLRQPVTHASVAWRPLRNLVALGLGSVLVAGGVLAVTVRNPDLGEKQAALENFDTVEKKCLAAYNAAVNKVNERKITDTDFANVIEQDVLPDWRSARERLSKAHDLPADLTDYVRLRQEAWELMAQALRKHDGALRQQAEEKNKQAEASLKRINEKGGK
jgi:rhomboid protease GluP